MHNISCCKHTFSGCHIVFIYNQKSAFRAFQACGSTDQFSSWSLADGDNGRICRDQFFFLFVSDHFLIFVQNRFTEYRSLFGNAFDFFFKNEFCTVKLGVGYLMGTCCHSLSSCIEGYMLSTVSQCCTCYVHGCVSHTDNGYAFTQIVSPRIGKVVNSIMDISKTFALNAKITRFPCSSADKYRCIAVTEQIFYLKNCADGCIRTDHNAHFCHFLSVAFENGLWQTEFRNAVLHDTANLVFPFKNSYAISLLCQKNSYCHTSRTCTDHCHFFSFFFSCFYFHTI